MSTTVRVRDEDKAFLDQLQAQILLEAGERVSLDEVLRRSLAVVRRHREELFARDAPFAVSDEQWVRLMDRRRDFGDPMDHDAIDDLVYGDPHA